MQMEVLVKIDVEMTDETMAAAIDMVNPEIGVYTLNQLLAATSVQAKVARVVVFD